MRRSRQVTAVVLTIAFANMLFLLQAGNVSAQTYGICHATGRSEDSYEYIPPSSNAYQQHYDNHFGVDGGDYFASTAEFAANQCFRPAVVNTPTPVTPTPVTPTPVTPAPATNTPIPATNTPVPGQPTATMAPGQPTATTAPGQPTQVPAQPTATTAAVTAFPSTGQGPDDSGSNGGMYLLVLAGSVMAFGTGMAIMRQQRAERRG